MVEEVLLSENTTEETAKLVYILYFVGLIFGLSAIVGVVIAYINRDDAPEWLKSHYQFQIRTFWIGLLFLFMGIILSFVLIGILVILFWIIWVIVRCAKGMKSLDKKESHPNPTGWMF